MTKLSTHAAGRSAACMLSWGFGLACIVTGCNAPVSGASPAAGNAKPAIAGAPAVVSPDTAARTLAAAAGTRYRVDQTAGAAGSLSGAVSFVGELPADTLITPNRDSTGCKPFTDVVLPVTRTAAPAGEGEAAEHSVGNAVVWLVGVTHGPRDRFQRRVSVVLDGCHLEPRVLVAAAGATIIASNRDDMAASLRFVEYGQSTVTPRAVLGFTDPGQVVPNSVALAKPGLVAVTDDKHPWVRAFIAVAPHPFVAVTLPDGKFAFDGVPAGTYKLVVWHERLGTRVVPVTVTRGAAELVRVKY